MALSAGHSVVVTVLLNPREAGGSSRTAHEGQRCPGHQVCAPVAILRAVQVELYLLLAQCKIKSFGESKAPPLGPCGPRSSRLGRLEKIGRQRRAEVGRRTSALLIRLPRAPRHPAGRCLQLTHPTRMSWDSLRILMAFLRGGGGAPE